MNATEKDNVFYCDCGFSWRRGMSGSHNCEDGLRAKLTDMAVQLANAESKCRALAAENVTVKECASDVMRHVYRSKTYLNSNRVVDAIQGLQCAIERKAGKTPATSAFLAEVRAQGVEALVLRRKTAARIARERDDLRAADALEGEAYRAQMFADEIRQEAK